MDENKSLKEVGETPNTQTGASTKSEKIKNDSATEIHDTLEIDPVTQRLQEVQKKIRTRRINGGFNGIFGGAKVSEQIRQAREKRDGGASTTTEQDTDSQE